MPLHWDDRYKELAYEIWRTDTKQPMQVVTDKLNSLEGTDIPMDTVADWRTRREWWARWHKERSALSPRMLEKHLEGLRVAAPEMIQLLASHARGELEMSLSQVHAAKLIVQENRISAGVVVVNDVVEHMPVVAHTPSMDELRMREEALRSLPPG
jgi:hypothetical protein